MLTSSKDWSGAFCYLQRAVTLSRQATGRLEEATMSFESARAFISRILEDDELVERLRSAPSPIEREGIAREAGYDFDCDELRAARDEVPESSDSPQWWGWPGGGPMYGVGHPWPR